MSENIKDVNGVDSARLLSYLERIERLEEERKALQIDILLNTRTAKNDFISE